MRVLDALHMALTFVSAITALRSVAYRIDTVW